MFRFAGDQMSNNFWKNEIGKLRSYPGSDYVRMTTFYGDEETWMFVEEEFLRKLEENSERERTIGKGSPQIDLLRVSPHFHRQWSKFAIIKASEKGKKPSYRLYIKSAEGVIGLEKARRDFASFQKEVSRRRLDIRFQP